MMISLNIPAIYLKISENKALYNQKEEYEKEKSIRDNVLGKEMTLLYLLLHQVRSFCKRKYNLLQKSRDSLIK
jgi:hypothetical protein